MFNFAHFTFCFKLYTCNVFMMIKWINENCLQRVGKYFQHVGLTPNKIIMWTILQYSKAFVNCTQWKKRKNNWTVTFVIDLGSWNSILNIHVTLSHLHNLNTVQPPRSTRSSSLVTLARPSISSSLRITDRSFQYASPRLWNQLPASVCQPRTNLPNSDSPSSLSGTLIIHHPITLSFQA